MNVVKFYKIITDDCILLTIQFFMSTEWSYITVDNVMNQNQPKAQFVHCDYVHNTKDVKIKKSEYFSYFNFNKTHAFSWLDF